MKGKVVPDVKRKTLRQIIVSSDELGSYQTLTEKGYQHGRVLHSADEFVSGIHHVNGVEGFWSHLKRGIRSTHASVSPQHLQKYVDEFSYRYNHRHEPADMFRRMLAQVSKPTSS